MREKKTVVSAVFVPQGERICTYMHSHNYIYTQMQRKSALSLGNSDTHTYTHSGVPRGLCVSKPWWNAQIT